MHDALEAVIADLGDLLQGMKEKEAQLAPE
jgi:hypothetical protein